MNKLEEEYLTEHPEMIPKKVLLLKKKMELLGVGKKSLKSKLVESLTQSNKDLEQKIENLDSRQNCLKNHGQLTTVKELARELDILNKHLKTERDYLGDLEPQIQEVEFKILREKQVSKKTSVHPSYMQNPEKCKESNQQKLHAISGQLSEEQAKNAELRENVRTLMTERKIFNKSFNGLLEKLEDGKKYMKELNTSVQHALLLRENMQNKLNLLHERETKQKKSQEEEMRDLQMRLENESTYKRFFAKKNKIRQLLPSATKDAANKRKSDLDKLTKCNQIYDDVVELCKSDISQNPFGCTEVVNVIKAREEKNISLFNFATKIYDELQAVRGKVLDQEKCFEDRYSEREDKIARHEVQKESLQSLLNEMEERKLGSIDDLRAGIRVQEKLCAGIDQLVKITKADTSAISLLLGDNDHTSQFNYKLFIQAVERQVMELMEVARLQPRAPSKSKTWEKSKTLQSREKSIYDLESKIILTRPCLMCYSGKKEQLR